MIGEALTDPTCTTHPKLEKRRKIKLYVPVRMVW